MLKKTRFKYELLQNNYSYLLLDLYEYLKQRDIKSTYSLTLKPCSTVIQISQSVSMTVFSCSILRRKVRQDTNYLLDG